MPTREVEIRERKGRAGGREGRKRERRRKKEQERERKDREQAGLDVSAEHRGNLWIHHRGAHVSGP